MFKIYNDKNEKLIPSLSECNDIINGGRKWFSELKDSIHKSFKKIKFGSKYVDKVLQNLLKEKNLLKKEIQMMKNVPISLNLIDLKKNLENIEKKI